MSTVSFLTSEELATFKDEVREGRCVLLDVREEREYEAGHIPLALSKPLSKVEAWINDLDKDMESITYCRSGKRSHRAAEILVSRGFQTVHTLEGGLNSWKKPLSKE